MNEDIGADSGLQLASTKWMTMSTPTWLLIEKSKTSFVSQMSIFKSVYRTAAAPVQVA